MTFVRNRIPALSHALNRVSPEKLKRAFLSNMEQLAREGAFKGTKRIALRFFIRMMGPDGSLYPSHAKVAEECGLSERTVWAALNEAEQLGLLRVTPRYVYDPDKGKTVRTSNLYEVVLTKIERTVAIVAATARKAREAAQREALATVRMAQGLFHDLTATDAEDPLNSIFRKREKARSASHMSVSDTIDWCLRNSKPI